MILIGYTMKNITYYYSIIRHFPIPSNDVINCIVKSNSKFNNLSVVFEMN